MKNKVNKFIKKGTDNLGKSRFNSVEMIMILIMGLLSGILVSTIFKTTLNGTTDNSSNEIISVYNNLKEKYYGDIDEEALEQAAIAGMLSILGDEYSEYLSSYESSDFNDKLNGEFVGLGVQIRKVGESAPVVTEVYDNSPAAKAGLMVGDLLLKVNGEDISTLSLSEVVDKIKNKKENITLEVQREDETIVLEATTGDVVITSVEQEIIEGEQKKIGYAKLSLFAKNSASQLALAFDSFDKAGVNSVILDLRDNPGGHLDVAEEILNMFLDDTKILYQIKGKDNTEKVYSSKGEKRNYNLVILVNESSTSASELISASLKEGYGAILVGTTTYGKGTVQQTMSLEDGSMIKYTTNTWLTPNGNSINEVGITPDYIIEQTDGDNQLAKAIEILDVN